MATLPAKTRGRGRRWPAPARTSCAKRHAKSHQGCRKEKSVSVSTKRKKLVRDGGRTFQTEAHGTRKEAYSHLGILSLAGEHNGKQAAMASLQAQLEAAEAALTIPLPHNASRSGASHPFAIIAATGDRFAQLPRGMVEGRAGGTG